MCQSAAEGGQRCASHTRPRFTSAAPGTREWDDAAAEYASTSEGRKTIDDMRFNARMNGQFDTEAACEVAIRRGNNRRQAAQDARQWAQEQQHPLSA